MPREEARPNFEKGATSGTFNLPYGSDDDEEEFIYVPPKLLEGKDTQVPIAPISDITIQEIKGVFPKELREESYESSFSDTNFVKTVAYKKILWKFFEKESLELMRQKK